MTVTRDGVIFVGTCTPIQKKITKYAAIVIDTFPGSSSLLGQFNITMDSYSGMFCNVKTVENPVRHKQFRQALKGFSTRTLSIWLKELEKGGILERHRYNEIPPRVE